MRLKSPRAQPFTESEGPMKFHIRGGRLIDPSQRIDGAFDLWVEDGRISTLLREKEKPPGRPDLEIDARGKVVAPGFIDLHAHLRDPGQTEKEDLKSGTQAAVAGGFTAVLCMPNTNPVNDSPEVTKAILQRAQELGRCRVFPVGAVSQGLQGKKLSPMEKLKAAGCVAFSDEAGLF